MGCDAIVHHMGWGRSYINPRGQLLAEFLAASDLYWCNIGNTPTFRVANKSEVIDITLADLPTLDRVSKNPSVSDHAFITSTILKGWEMFFRESLAVYHKLGKLGKKSDSMVRGVGLSLLLERTTEQWKEVQFLNAGWLAFPCFWSLICLVPLNVWDLFFY